MDKIHEVTGMKLEGPRDAMTERKQRRRLGLKESTAQGEKVPIMYRNMR